MSTEPTSAASAKDLVWHTDVPCPFCTLGCDDLRIGLSEATTAEPQIEADGCPRAQRGFSEQLRPLPACTRNGTAMDRRLAVRDAAERLAAAEWIHVAGAGVDVAGARALIRLAGDLGASLDTTAGQRYRRDSAGLLSTGAWRTTQGEIRSRADCVILIGAEPDAQTPRFLDRCVPPGAPPLGDGRPRRVIWVGGNRMPERLRERHPDVLHVPVPDAYLPAAVGLLRAEMSGHRYTRVRFDDIDADALIAALDQVTGIVRDSAYTALVWNPDQLPLPYGDLLGEQLDLLVRELNQHARAGALPLDGPAGSTLGQVTTWLTGMPLPVRFRKDGSVSRDPHHLSTESYLSRQGLHPERDVLLWVSPLGNVSPPSTRACTILLTAASQADATGRATPGDLVIPVGTPGVHTAGATFRNDEVVTLPLRALAPSMAGATPGVDETVHELEQELASCERS